MSRKEIVDELHRSMRKNFKRRHVVMRGINDLLQADLVEMIPYAKLNRNYKYLLTVIDTFSKYGWAIPIKSKTGQQVANAMETIMRTLRDPPKNIQTDDGKEFFNKYFEKIMKNNGINHYSTFSGLKASIVERFNRTLKNKMWKQFSLQGTYKWLPIVKQLVDQYNNTTHSTIKMKPSQVNRNNEQKLLNTVYNRMKIFLPGRYKVGDFVRVSKYKKVFEKGYTPNWTTEIFQVQEVRITDPVTYILRDYRGNTLKGGFYEFEIQKVKYPDAYLVEKIIRQDGNKVYVKWLGFDNSHNSYINKNDLI